ncbi:hypothetical protein Q0812_06505 [Brevundimonas sp. 2R-24]|uniref:Lysozyme n=1 Tax=Peiella sedimenti TaxID=3061083 RepID=A0ABT8SKI4_9CAUL|nr:hypothetical protein [Caulobacteraceae bacterium XZ-24]
MTRLFSNLAARGLLAWAVAATLAAGAQTWRVDRLKADAGRAEAARARELADARVAEARQVAEIIERQRLINVDSDRAALAAERRIAAASRSLSQQVESHAPSSDPDHCPVPVGLVRLHDAAAQGLSSPLPDPAGRSDDAASGLESSALAATVVENYGACHAVADRLTRLQAWVADQAAE